MIKKIGNIRMKASSILLSMLLSTASIWGQEISLTPIDSVALSGGKQQCPEVIIDSIITTTGDGQYIDRRYEEWNDAGQQTLIGNEEYLEGKPHKGEKYSNSYDPQGRLVRTDYYIVGNNQIIFWGYETFEYEENKDWSKSVFNYLDENEEWSIRHSITHKYDEKDQLIEQVVIAGDTINDRKDIYAYDEAGNKILYETYDWDKTTNDWVIRQRNEFAFDKQGNEIMCTKYSRYRNNLTGNIRYERTFNEFGQRTSFTLYDWDNDKWVANNRKEYTFTSSGELSVVTEYDWKENDWVLDDKITYIYNDCDSLILYYTEGPNGLVYKEEYDYDDNGNPLFVHSYKMLLGNWTIVDSEEWTYNGQGLQTDYVYYYAGVDVEDGKIVYYTPWQCIEYHTNTYDEAGNLLKHIEKQGDYHGRLFVSETEEYAYDAMGRQTSHIHSEFNLSPNDLINSRKTETVYGDLTTTVNVYDWDDDEEAWELLHSETLGHDADSQLVTNWDYQNEWGKYHEVMEYYDDGRYKSDVYHWESISNPESREDKKKDFFYNDEECWTRVYEYTLADDEWQVVSIYTIYWHYPATTDLEVLPETSLLRPTNARKALVNGKIIIRHSNRTIGINGIEINE